MNNNQIDIQLEKLTDKDIEELIELSKVWVEENISFGLIVNGIEDIKEPCVVAREGEKIVGYAFGHYYVTEERTSYIEIGSNCFFIDEVYVLPKYRSRGIGKQLMDTLEKEVSKNVEYITLSTSTKDYKRILKFYVEECGMIFHSAYLIKKSEKEL